MSYIETASATDIGCVRSVNQDRLYSNVGNINDITCGLFVVADGMGGLTDGHVAASVAINTIDAWWYDCLRSMLRNGAPEKHLMRNEFDTILRTINKHILRRNREGNIISGTTFSLLLIYNRQYYIAHCGDSRVYASQSEGLHKKQLRQLTEDHSWSAEQLRRNILSFEEIIANPHKNALTSCLGVFEHPRIYLSSGETHPLDIFILCSDGLYNMVSDKQLRKLTINQKNCKGLVDKCMQMALKQGANDNVSIIAVKMQA